MPLTKSDFEAAMKTHYFPAIKDQLENTTYFMSRLERYTEETGGNFLQMTVRSGRTGSIGARGDSTASTDALPTGDKPSYNKATFAVKPQYAVVQLSGLSMRSSRNPNYALARAQARDMEDTSKDFKKDINRQVFGDGSGELCQINTTTTSTIIAVTSVNYPTNATKFLYPGEPIDVNLVTSGVNQTLANVVASVDSASQVTLTTSTAVSTSTTQAMYRTNNMTLTTIKEMFGLLAAIDNSNPSAVPGGATRATANYGNINRTTSPWWKGQELNNSGTLRSFSVNLIESGIDLAETAAGGVTSLLQTNHAIYRLYGSLLTAAKLYDGAQMNLDGGWNALSVNGLPMVKDVECPDYTVFCIDESTFYLGVLTDWAWLTDDDNGAILKRLPGKDQYEAVLNRDMELLCDKPGASTKIQDIAHS